MAQDAFFRMSREIVYDNLSYYYPYGNTRPTYLFHGMDPDQPEARILCLASGDLRSPLYSLWREYANSCNGGSKQKVTFVINDYSAHVMARNLIMLYLLFKTDALAKDIWAIWFCMTLTGEQHQLLMKTIEIVLSDPTLAKSLVTFHSHSDQDAIFCALKNWKEWKISVPEMLAMKKRDFRPPSYTRDQPFDLKPSAKMLFIRQAMFGGCKSSEDLNVNLTEVDQFEETLSLPFPGKRSAEARPNCVNITLFRNEEKMDFHYGYPALGIQYAIFDAFAKSNSATPFLDCYAQQFALWIDAARKHAARVTWVFSSAHCTDFCTALSVENQRFDFIDTTNVCDHIGLTSVLLSTRPILAGRMQTCSFLHYIHNLDAYQYLAQELVVSLDFVPTVFGLRPLGYEGESVRPDSAQWQCFGIPDILPTLQDSPSRGETIIHWVPAWDHDVFRFGLADSCPLYSEIVKLVQTFREVEFFKCNTHHYAAALAPLLWRIFFADRARIDAVIEKAVQHPYPEFPFYGECVSELRMMLDVLEGKVDGVRAVTIPFPSEHLPNMELLRAEPSTKQPRVHVAIPSQADKKQADFHAVWTSKDPNTGRTTHVSCVLPDILLKQTDVLLVPNLNGFIYKDDWKVERAPPSIIRDLRSLALGSCSDELPKWCPKPLYHEAESEAKVEFAAIPSEWMKVLLPNDQQNGKVDVENKGVQCIRIGIRKKGGFVSEHALSIRFPFPIDSSKARLLFSRKRSNLTVVLPKVKHANTESVTSQFWLEDTISLHKSPLSNERYFSISGMQCTQKEKDILQKELESQMTPLLHLKEALMAIFQTDNDLYSFQFDHGTSLLEMAGFAWILKHDIRQDHLSGIPYADLSICFLNETIFGEVLPLWTSEVRNRDVRRLLITDASACVYIEMLFQECLSRMMKRSAPHPKAPKWTHKRFQRYLIPLLIRKEVDICGDLKGKLKSKLTPGPDPEPKSPLSNLADLLKAVLPKESASLQAPFIQQPSNEHERELEQMKQRGNQLVKVGNYYGALQVYNELSAKVGGSIMDSGTAPFVKDLFVAVMCNNMLCQVRLLQELPDGHPTKISDSKTFVQSMATFPMFPQMLLSKSHTQDQINSYKVKCLFRYGLICNIAGDFHRALESLEEASKLAPEDEAIRKALSSVKSKVAR